MIPPPIKIRPCDAGPSRLPKELEVTCHFFGYYFSAISEKYYETQLWKQEHVLAEFIWRFKDFDELILKLFQSILKKFISSQSREYIDNFILFESSNYFNHKIVLKNFEFYTDPHSDYFGALANYGIIGFLIFLGFPIYVVLEYLKNFNLKKSYKDSLILFLIIIMIFIEAIITDLFHTQFVWIIFAMYLFSLNLKNNKI